ncbi:hypothetical protein CEE37_01490 [candidate division LCP-89 bacterium B3_LCP]|uniref:Thioesterase n=1 Tax=candidate division LCP-89 bacterium B3_LCP TaxID=2012998 RepID=A0A532V5C0_UNCL8|nr:MAG: hypothetical protein CEE37_01490 [candidate division LCP-89 bacterium B3_LCP]
MKQKLSCQLKVRSYELDGYGHVNHAVFLHYYEQARVEFLEQRELSFGSLLKEGYIFVIVRAEVDYIKPLCSADIIEITGKIEDTGESSVTLRQEMRKMPSGELVSKGRFVAVFLDRQTKQPTGVANSFRKAFFDL